MENVDLLTALKKYAVFSGRARRKEYWLFTLLSWLLYIAAGILDGLESTAEESSELWGTLVTLALLVPGLAVAIRRLHDIGKSGWWMLLWLLPIFGPIVLLILSLMDSQPGDNQYGPNPKEIL